MNVVLLFEGTGQGVEGKFTNVTRLREMLVEDEGQKVRLESGPGTHFGAYLFGKVFGSDCRAILRSSRRWLQQNHSRNDKLFLFGFSRGALLARKLAEWCDKLGIAVTYLGLWDTVDSAVKVDVSETCPKGVAFARHAVARDEKRRYFQLVPLVFEETRGGAQGEERVFPGVHSDIGGLYADNHDMADATLAWIADAAVARGLRLKPDAKLRHDLDVEKLPTHDSFRLISNLWGLLGSSVRALSRRKSDEEVELPSDAERTPRPRNTRPRIPVDAVSPPR